MKKTKYERIIIHSLDEIPQHFDSEDAERDWWAEHDLSLELWDSLEDTTAELDEIMPLPEGPRRARAKR
jgi:hypothetical protein